MDFLLQKIKRGTDNVKLVDWPGTQTKVALKILSQGDHQAAAFDTDRIFITAKIPVNRENSSVWDQELATQILWRTLRNPENLKETVCASITDFRNSLTRNEIDILTDEYLTFEIDVNPASKTLSDEELDRVVLEIKKKPDSILVSSFSTCLLKKLIITLAKQPVSLPQING